MGRRADVFEEIIDGIGMPGFVMRARGTIFGANGLGCEVWARGPSEWLVSTAGELFKADRSRPTALATCRSPAVAGLPPSACADITDGVGLNCIWAFRVGDNALRRRIADGSANDSDAPAKAQGARNWAASMGAMASAAATFGVLFVEVVSGA